MFLFTAEPKSENRQQEVPITDKTEAVENVTSSTTVNTKVIPKKLSLLSQKNSKSNLNATNKASNVQPVATKKPNIAQVSKSLLGMLGEDDETSGKKAVREWQPNEVVSLYAVHSQTPVTLPNFWDEISNQLKSKGIHRSKEECEQRWFSVSNIAIFELFVMVFY